ncbi:DUF1467 family protein [Sphingomicrobium marinum]|uniref:DUF1467 family protein n=1 Tax=Sphingomicrobium marinum TaxID=1227950 RepID=UPI002240DA00|nr:DUF1467 family protein [Sphingomicrobium marinum]
MQLASVIAVYFLIFVAVAFIMLPFGVKTDEEAGKKLVPGQAESAPSSFNLKRHLTRAAIIAAVLTGLYVLNYEMGWLTSEDLNFFDRDF